MEISEINIYPIKSLGGISLNKSIIEKRGLQYDRRFLLVDKNGKFLTQREFPQMATILCQLSGLMKLLTDKPKMETLQIPFDFSKRWNDKLIEVEIWNSKCQALVAEDSINDWFCKALETDCRLVEMPETTHRLINERFNKGNEIVSFADGYPFLIIAESSLEDLNSRLENKLPMNRFRPNLVVKGAEPFAEDNWKKIKIGKTIFRATKPCARCVITTIDQSNGEFNGKEPLKTLAAYRTAKRVFPDSFEKLDLNENAVLFGQNLVAENFGEEIKIGDKLEILE